LKQKSEVVLKYFLFSGTDIDIPNGGSIEFENVHRLLAPVDGNISVRFT
jgi:hypothetical protein